MLKHEHQPTRGVRVAMVASSLRLGGAEKQSVYMARALLEAGIDVVFFQLGPGGYYETMLQEIGVPMHRLYAANRPWVILVRLIQALRRWRPDVVMACQFDDLLYGGPAGRCCRALTLGGIRSDGLSELGWRPWLSHWMVRMTHGLIANSYHATRNLVSRGIRAQDIKVLPNVIDLQDFDARSQSAFSASFAPERVVVTAVATLHSGKRIDRFIDALAIARRREPALAGIIAGADGGAKGALQERAKALGLRRHDLVFAGECENVPALLARSALLLFTSDYEGFPNVILEAMAARLPIITTPAGDAGLVVQDGKSGYVVEKDDIEAMATHLVRLAQSAGLRGALGEAGRKRVEQEYNYNRLSDRLISIFQTFAAQMGRTPLHDQLTESIQPLCAI